MKSFGGTELIESAAGTVQKTHAGNEVLIDKCAHPNCVRSWAGQCNIECYQGQGTAPDLDHGCRTSPPGMVRAATLHAAAAQPEIAIGVVGGASGVGKPNDHC